MIPLLKSVVSALLVKSNGIVTQFGSIFFSLSREVFLQVVNALLVGDIFHRDTALGLVEGVKIGSSSLSDSFKPSGSLMPHAVPFSL